MPIFQRRSPPPPRQKDYHRYLPEVREDFLECCAYCLLHELLAAGADNFELDHFRPKSKLQFKHLETDFYNLYYSCHICNHYKSSIWPSEELQAAGYYFVDFCVDAYSTHFEEDANGVWHVRTRAGQYSSERLRLNRKHLIKIRRLLREIAERLGTSSLNWDVPCKFLVERVEQLKNILA